MTLALTVTGLLAAPLAVITAASPAHAVTRDIQILATNDFHGRLADRPTGSNNPEPIEIASVMAGGVKQLEAQAAAAGTPSLFAAGGDMIGASTFESFIQRDKPTIDVLNGAGLDVSAAGNHEFDGGYNDLVNRVMAPESAANPEGGANWQYLAANVRRKSDDSYALPDVTARTPDAADRSDGASWMTTVGGVDVGFVGAVTEDLPALVSPAGIADVKITNIVAEANAAADRLTADGADLVVLLVHEGAATTNIASATDDSAFGRIVKGVDADVDAIVSGHTHLAYDHRIGGRPVVSAGQYGAKLNQLVFTVNTDPDGNPATNDSAVSVKSTAIVDLFGPDPDGSSGPKATPPLFPVDAPTKEIVDRAFARADELGRQVLGKVNGAFRRARLANGDENRGGESTLGNLVAEVQRWATSTPEAGSAQIAFMNPGGLRADMTGNSTGGTYPADLTYKQAAVVQPFANTLVNMRMTGAQIKKVLEQQWQRDDKGQVPTRPFLRLGTSKGFFATYDTRRPEGDRVTGMWLDGKRIESATSYSVTANSFLAGGGDNFFAFREATAKRDTGKADLQAMVDYMATRTAANPLPVDYQQHFVGVQWPADRPRFYRIGQRVELGLSSLAMTGTGDLRDRTLDVSTKDAKLWRAWVDNTLATDPFDEAGRSDVAVRLTGKTRPGEQVLTFKGATTGSTFDLPIEVRKALAIVKAAKFPKKVVADRTRTKLRLKVKARGLDQVFGSVLVKAGGEKYRAKLRKGKVVLRLDAFEKAGTKKIVIIYRGGKVVRGKRTVLRVNVQQR